MTPYQYAANNPILFIDVNGDSVFVNTLDGQKQVLSILGKAFGENASGFEFNKHNKLVFTGDVNAFSGTEKEVFNGLMKVANDTDITNVTFGKNSITSGHGGEGVATMTDNPSLTENKLFIDPQEVVSTQIGTNRTTEYSTPNGGTTTVAAMAATDRSGNPLKTGSFVEEPVYKHDSKAARFFHGIGHILYQKSNQQESVIAYDNKARSIFKRRNRRGKLKPAPEAPNQVDSAHKNQP